MAENENIKVFLIYLLLFSLEFKILIYLARKAQIALLLIQKIKILDKYLNFSNIFFKKKTLKLLKLIDLNYYIFKLKKISKYFIN